jgi:type 1 glutamine amidotransferase
MKSLLSSVVAGFTALVVAHAELGHKFPEIKPDELAKIQAALPTASAKPIKPRRLLVFYLTEGFVHGSIPYGNEALQQIGVKTGAYTADLSEDMAVFNPDKLKDYDAVLFNNTTQLKFTDPAARQALLDYAKTGRGVIGIHSATDNFPTWPEGKALMGGAFKGHPWTSGEVEAVKVDDTHHPVNAAFKGQGFWINDEIYQIVDPYSRSLVRVLLSLDMSKPQNQRDPKKIVRTDNDFPISWIKTTEGGGRVFYSSLGHNPSIYWTPQVLQHFLDGIQFALGDLTADAVPTAQVQTAPETSLAPETSSALNPRPLKPTAVPTPAVPTPTP